MDENTLAYIQVVSLKKTFELMASNTIEFRWEKSKMDCEEQLEIVIDRIVEMAENELNECNKYNEVIIVENEETSVNNEIPSAIIEETGKTAIETNNADADVLFDCQN